VSQSFTISDWRFLHECGATAEMTPAEYLDANLHRNISPCRGCRAKTFTQHASDCRHAALAHVCLLADDWSTHERSEAVFTKSDRNFLRACGISVEPAIKIARPDGTVRILQSLGLPVTRENYLMLAFAGHPPKELDGEIEAMLPEELRAEEDSEEDSDDDNDDTCDAPSAGPCGEPSHTPVNATDPEEDDDDEED
jgi:hypothetical protein